MQGLLLQTRAVLEFRTKEAARNVTVHLAVGDDERQIRMIIEGIFELPQKTLIPRHQLIAVAAVIQE